MACNIARSSDKVSSSRAHRMCVQWGPCAAVRHGRSGPQGEREGSRSFGRRAKDGASVEPVRAERTFRPGMDEKRGTGVAFLWATFLWPRKERWHARLGGARKKDMDVKQLDDRLSAIDHQCSVQKQYAYISGLPTCACSSSFSSGASPGACASHAAGRRIPSEVIRLVSADPRLMPTSMRWNAPIGFST